MRTARQVSHTNVCRIYDAGEADGHHFLSMEYIDGEDLASLLRRIGHLPKDKAIQIARQLCAGLAASHEIGVLHRDLKPANIMIDGRGRARITDFGLARFAEEIEGADILSGTPAYMAPEQLAGREVSVRSDLYSLGLVLYELFTGKPAFKATSVDELKRLRSETTPSSPSSLMDDFDPTVERVILRCLETDPARRPSSALAVAAALPGGDPLAAALAAGETPSPQMVAEAGDQAAVVASDRLERARPLLRGARRLRRCCRAARRSWEWRRSRSRPKCFRSARGRSSRRRATTGQPADSLFAFDANRDYLADVLRRAGPGAARWDVLRATPPSGIVFWYRQSPAPLVPLNGARDRIVAGRSSGFHSGNGAGRPRRRRTADLVARGSGRAHAARIGCAGAGLGAAPPRDRCRCGVARARAAGVGATGLRGSSRRLDRIVARETGGAAPDRGRRGGWQARLAADRPAVDPPRGGAGAATQASGLEPRSRCACSRPECVVVAAGFVALRNVRRGRGDRRGALRLALYLGAARFLWFLGAHHVASTAEFDLFMSHLAYAMLQVGLAYVFYLAIEPYARRLWPRILVSWVRILDGGFRDPLVGRDLLVGAAAGAVVALVGRLQFWIPAALGGTVGAPDLRSLDLRAAPGNRAGVRLRRGHPYRTRSWRSSSR